MGYSKELDLNGSIILLVTPSKSTEDSRVTTSSFGSDLKKA